MTDDDEMILASAAEFLVEGGEEDAASVLLSCDLEVWESGDTWFVGDETHHAIHVKVTGPRSAYDVLTDASRPTTEAIRRALEAALPEKTYIKHFTVHAKRAQIDPGWRAELLEIARGVGVNNQTTFGRNMRSWKNLHFRSQSEIKVAEELDRVGVLFLPNCRGRVGRPGSRVNREADFLVCRNGRWGILEVDGEPFHPPTRVVQDHERDRLFKEHGIRLVEHFDATSCFRDPAKVVAQFLELPENA